MKCEVGGRVYEARVAFDDEASVFFGEVMHLRDVITFQGTSVDELRTAFVDSVEDYLDFCREKGEEPEKPYSGKFLLRVEPEEHRQFASAADRAGLSLNTWARQALTMAANAHTGPWSRLRRPSGPGMLLWRERHDPHWAFTSSIFRVLCTESEVSQRFEYYSHHDAASVMKLLGFEVPTATPEP